MSMPDRPPLDFLHTELTIFNIKGNRYRLRVRIDYARQLVYIHDFMTHATYDKLK